jgi:predicted HTH transcriptional regulator
MPFDKEDFLEEDRKSAKESIIEMILLYKKVAPNQIHQNTGISLSMIQRDLKYLCKERVIKKIGKAPRVYYELYISGQAQSTMNT